MEPARAFTDAQKYSLIGLLDKKITEGVKK
jgi:hypothetical protein